MTTETLVMLLSVFVASAIAGGLGVQNLKLRKQLKAARTASREFDKWSEAQRFWAGVEFSLDQTRAAITEKVTLALRDQPDISPADQGKLRDLTRGIVDRRIEQRIGAVPSPVRVEDYQIDLRDTANAAAKVLEPYYLDRISPDLEIPVRVLQAIAEAMDLDRAVVKKALQKWPLS
ncbi:hypothetical protein PP613_23675 [Mycobacteroides abscessus]|nr:hypothetical protein [Mycobacteroides abscessus]MDM2412344.1 hypothetical protein [Mycobacteroides abscessus]